jgi:hypothetical protein
MWNYKTLKIQRTFQFWCRILEFQNSFATQKMKLNVHDAFKKIIVYYTRKHKNVKHWLWLKLLSFLKMKHWIYKKSPYSFKNSYLFKNYEKKTCNVLGQI